MAKKFEHNAMKDDVIVERNSYLSNPTLTQPIFSQINFTVLGEKNFDLLSKYTIEGKVGRGSYGTVVKAYDQQLHKCVAIKRIWNVFGNNKGVLKDEKVRYEFQKRIYREIKLMRIFNHENMVKLIDLIPPRSYESFNNIYLVMEYVDTDLRTVLLKSKLTELHTRYILFQLLCVIKVLHMNYIIHRNLKPGNILLTCNSTVKICDFGLSRGNVKIPIDNGFELPSTPIPNIHYCSPELLMCAEKITGALDMWAIGCIFFEMLTGSVLFSGVKFSQQLNLIFAVFGIPKDIKNFPGCDKAKLYISELNPEKFPGESFDDKLPGISTDAIDLLKRMLELDSSKRITVYDALAHKFFEGCPLPQEKEIVNNNRSLISSLENEELINFKEKIFDEIIDFNIKENGLFVKKN